MTSFTWHGGQPSDERDTLIAEPPQGIGRLVSAATNDTYASFEDFWTRWATSSGVLGLLVLAISSALAPADPSAPFSDWLLYRSGAPIALLGVFGVYLVLDKLSDAPQSTFVGTEGAARVTGAGGAGRRVELVRFVDVLRLSKRLEAAAGGGVDVDVRLYGTDERLLFAIVGHVPGLTLTVDDNQVVVPVGLPPHGSVLAFAVAVEQALAAFRGKTAKPAPTVASSSKKKKKARKRR